MVLLAVVSLVLSGLAGTASANAYVYDGGAELDAGTTVRAIGLEIRSTDTQAGSAALNYDSSLNFYATNTADDLLGQARVA